MMDKLSPEWLFERHSEQVIRKWLGQLRYFYYKRAWGGHANDGDEFQTAFLYTDRQDLIHKLGQLGITLNVIPDDFPRPVIGQTYPAAEFAKFKNAIREHPDLEQPGHSILFGYQTFIWIYSNSIRITLSGTRDGNCYDVSQDDFEACLELEKHFDNLDWQNIADKSPEKSACCISRSKYPELYRQ